MPPSFVGSLSSWKMPSSIGDLVWNLYLWSCYISICVIMQYVIMGLQCVHVCVLYVPVSYGLIWIFAWFVLGFVDVSCIKQEHNRSYDSRAYLGVYGHKPPKWIFFIVKSLNCRKIGPNSMQASLQKSQNPPNFFLAMPLYCFQLCVLFIFYWTLQFCVVSGKDTGAEGNGTHSKDQTSNFTWT